MTHESKPRLGISTCLLGEKVRHDGQHKHNRFLTDTLGKYVEYVPVCPEVECGLPTPREAMRLVGDPKNPRLLTSRTGRDITPTMMAWIPRSLKELKKQNLDGFIFKSKSPSSGMERVKVYNDRGGLSGKAPGMFAKAFMEAFPLLPVEEGGRLNDPNLRENFIERIFMLRRYRDMLAKKAKMSDLIAFHANHKFLLMAHSEQHCRPMGRLIAEKGAARKDVFAKYEAFMLEGMKRKATVAKHCNVLEHMMGFLKKLITADEKQELLEVINAFRTELVPLIVPVTLINHYVRKYDLEYLSDQYYLHPHPFELKLRNHA